VTAADVTRLGDIIAAEIAADGPMTVARYMALCLGHPEHGYYRRGNPFGARGDFVTAPEISQMFGELLGLWAAQLWLDMGRPAPVRLVELGPGRGTLTADALRAARAAPGFVEAVEVWMVETSPSLRAAQAARVPAVRHAELLAEVPGGPMIVLANEFFDALPVRQFVRTARGWAERVVGLAPEGLRWALGPAPAGLPDAPEGAVIERSAAGEAIAAEIGARLARDGGGALIVDYGAAAPATGGGDTLQALRAHSYADPLAEPGAADLTAHVDFARLAAALAGAGAAVAPLTTQGALLGALGIGPRAAALAARNPAQAAALEAQVRRLCDPNQMGALFKALAATGPDQPPPPGFGAFP
jgi:NADH dehydrogenase [ubiquinone] 1 alpha subcomplex assembly factor 7